MPTYQLKDGRIVSAGQIVDFDSTHTNAVAQLNPDEFAQFVVSTIADPPPSPPPPVTQVTQRQARLALLNAGLLTAVQNAVNAADQATQITWEFASVININDPLISVLGTKLNLTPDQIQTLFNTAATL